MLMDACVRASFSTSNPLVLVLSQIAAVKAIGRNLPEPLLQLVERHDFNASMDHFPRGVSDAPARTAALSAATPWKQLPVMSGILGRVAT